MKTLQWMRRLTVALLASLALQAAATDKTPTIEQHTANANGVQLHYLQAGAGSDTPVILLHGYAETSHMWLPLIAKLDDRRTVIAPDLRGAGDSSMPASGYDKKTMAQD